ncbi:hypothetical protein J2I47_20855 [Fibrella sp. HMF5335]|uniref:Uncharacterized protein n=1 Tax=Fibrella rubiginis TaxID=2817060 RepID=A0A939GIN6_9BACT|nr:hypothetical protein [Fibrella rubiginis]MBO0939016.1 hypothetical protein [Fibrella rubiginis]
MRLNNKLLNWLTAGYLCLPIILFFLGWLQLVYSILLTIGLVLGVFFYLKRINKEASWTTLPVLPTVVSVLLLFIWVYFSGIGGYANQDWDHHCRNAIFTDLITYKWPVYYNFSPGYHIGFLAGHKAALNYYFTFWLPAALVGSYFGRGIGDLCLLGWSYLGLLLILFQLVRLIHARHIIFVTLLFGLWSGLDSIGHLLIHHALANYKASIEIYSYFSYTSFTTDLYNVFNQVIPTWLITLWLLNNKKTISLFPIAILFAYGPLPFIGLALFYGIYVLISLYQQKYGTTWATVINQAWLQLDWVGTAVAVFVLGAPYLAFYKAHLPGLFSQFIGQRLVGLALSDQLKLVINYLLTCLVETGFYFLLIPLLSRSVYRDNKISYWICFWLLLFIPFWEFGVWRDFASRGSIPCLTILAVLMGKAMLDAYKKNGFSLALMLTVLVLGISWITPAWLLTKAPALTAKPTIRDGIGSFGNPQISDNHDPEGLGSSLSNFYSIEPQHRFFYRLLAKPSAEKSRR